MRLTHRKLARGNVIALNMTSMIDCIFLLLIFFMLNLAYHQAERNLESGIQTENSAAGRARSDFEPVIVEIARAGDGFAFQLGTRSIADAAELTRVLAQFRHKGDGAFVRVHDESPFALAAAAVQACYDAGFPTVSYVAEAPSGPAERRGGDAF